MTIGIGIIGCGARVRGVVQGILARDPALRVVAVHDPDARSIAAARAFAPEATEAPTVEALVRDPAVRWVLVGSYNNQHRAHACAALAAGRDVFCEKPLATTLDDCLAMREAWRASGRTFAIGFTLRYSPHYRAIHDAVARGAIGRLVSMDFTETLDFNHGGFIMGDWRRHHAVAGSMLLEKCCHDIDLANWMVGARARRVASFAGLAVFRPENAGLAERLGHDEHGRPAYRTWGGPVAVDPFGDDKDICDHQVAILEYENGVRASFHLNANSGIPERRMHLVGTEGTIRADVVTGRIELRRIGFGTPIEDIPTGAAGGHGGGDEVLCATLADCMLGRGQPATGLDDGLRSAVTCFALDEAADSGRVVDLGPYWARCGERHPHG